MKALIPILALACTLQGHAQTAFTKPSGYVKVDLVVGFNPVAVNLVSEVVVAGQMESEAANVLTDTDANFVTSLNDVNATYLIDIVGGAQNGAVAEITSFTATTVTIEGTGISAGAAQYSIRKARTLNETFGTGSAAQLTGSFDSNDADIVWVPDSGAPSGYSQFFYNNVGNEFRPTGAPFDAVVGKPHTLFYPDGIFVQVKSTAKTVTIFGDVKTTPTTVAAFTGFNLVAIPSPVGQTLASTKLSDFLAGSFDSNDADVVWVPSSTTPGTYDQYFYNNVQSQWKETSEPFQTTVDFGSTALPTAILIQRKGTSSAATLTLPDTFSL